MFFLPADDIKVFKPSTFFIVIHTAFGLQLEIQLTPTMQVYIKASVSNKRKLEGLFHFLRTFDYSVTHDMRSIGMSIKTKSLSSFRSLWRF